MNRLLRIEKLKSQISYFESNILNRFSEMEKWEQKEYQAVYDSYVSELSGLV